MTREAIALWRWEAGLVLCLGHIWKPGGKGGVEWGIQLLRRLWAISRDVGASEVWNRAKISGTRSPALEDIYM